MTSSSSSKDLSIIVPCYKVEQYLPRCLDSLVNQTLENIEIICINDGSPDGCLEILKDYERRYPDKIVIIDKENEGVWRGRWDGIAIARGEYIGFLDSDDYAEPEFAERLYSKAIATNADVTVCGFKRVDPETGKVFSREFCEERTGFTLAQDAGRMLELNGAPWNKAFRTSILKSMSDLQSPPPVLDDLVFHLIAYLGTRGRIEFIPEPLVNYMIRQGSIITTVRKEQIDGIFKAFREVRQLYIEAGASSSMVYALDASAFVHLGISLLFRLSYDKTQPLVHHVKTIRDFLDENFPSWVDSPYIRSGYAKRHGAAYQKILLSHRCFKRGLMPPFLATYRFVVEKSGREIKW